MTRSSEPLFPPSPPASLADPSQIVRNDWAAFSGLATLANHWARPAWPDGAQAYYWLIPLGDIAELRALAGACQQELASVPDLDPVPVELLHMTVYRVAAIGGASSKQLAEVASAAASRLKSMAPVRLRIGPLSGSAGAIRLSVAPWDRLMPVRDALVEAAVEVLGGTTAKGWRPHVSIAYNAVPRPAAPVVARVRELRDRRPVEAIVDRVELVRLMRTGRLYKWAPLRRIVLAGARTTNR